MQSYMKTEYLRGGGGGGFLRVITRVEGLCKNKFLALACTNLRRRDTRVGDIRKSKPSRYRVINYEVRTTRVEGLCESKPSLYRTQYNIKTLLDPARPGSSWLLFRFTFSACLLDRHISPRVHTLLHYIYGKIL